MAIVDLAIYAVPTADKDLFAKFCADTGPLFKKHGAISVADCWAVDVPDGKLTSLPMAVKCKPDESVAFSWITWPSKQARDEGWERCMSEMEAMDSKMPFDGQRMVFGAFETLLEL